MAPIFLRLERFLFDAVSTNHIHRRFRLEPGHPPAPVFTLPPLHLISLSAAVLALGYAAVAYRRQGRPGSTLCVGAPVFSILLVATLFAGRWPMMVQRYELNPDESQIIAGAVTLMADAMPWRSVDGMTTGPLCDYWLACAGWIGPLDFLVARLWAVVTFGCGLVLTYLTLRRLVAEMTARWAMLPPVLFAAFTTHHDYTHYSSEHLPCLLIAASVYTLVRMMQSGNRGSRVGWGAVAGLLLGTQPWAKLQMVPVAFSLGVAGILWWMLRRSGRPRDRLAGMAGMLAGSLIPSGFFLFVISINGLREEFFSRYIGHVWDYAASRPESPLQLLLHFGRFAGPNSGMASFAAGVLVWAVLGLAWYFRKRGRLIFSGPAVVIFVYAASSIVTCLISGRFNTHYLLLLVLPLALLSGWILGMLDEIAQPTPARARRSPGNLLPYALFSAILVLPPLVRRPFIPQPEMPVPLPHRDDAVSFKINQIAFPNDRLTTWGWMAEYNVRTHLAQGTRDAISVNLMEKSPRQQRMIRDYIADLERNRTRFFVDAVAPGSFAFSTPEWRHEHFPIVREYIATHYRLLDDHDGIRIFVRSESGHGLVANTQPNPRS